MSFDLRPLLYLGNGLFAIRESVQPFQIIPYSGTSSPDDLGIGGNEGQISRRCSSISVSLHMWTLPSRTPTATRFRLCPTLSRELFRRRTHAVPSTYSLGTMADQTAMVQHNIVNKVSCAELPPGFSTVHQAHLKDFTSPPKCDLTST